MAKQRIIAITGKKFQEGLHKKLSSSSPSDGIILRKRQG